MVPNNVAVSLGISLFLAQIQAIFPYRSRPKIVERYEETRYAPTWESLDSRPIPGWFDDAKIGIFLHWGVFSVPSFGGEWFWEDWRGAKDPEFVRFMGDNFRPNFAYQDFANEFTAEFFDPAQWAVLFRRSGARYVVLTSKHHEGFTLWPSKYSFGWNAKDVGPHRDLVGDLATAVRDYGMRFGLYHSLYEWFNPLYLSDKNSSFTKSDFTNKKLLPEMHELVDNYKPDVLWSDGDWEATDTYWRSKEFLAWLYSDSPVKDSVVVNDRWGVGIPCKHGDFYSCKDRFNPGVLQTHKWENAMTLDRDSWGFRRNANSSDYLTIQELLKTLAETVSCGGNLLINVGPTKEGTIAPIFQERLLQLGQWLEINGEAIYGSKPWQAQNDSVTPTVWYTTSNKADPKFVYAIVLDWPEFDLVSLDPRLIFGTPVVPEGVSATLLGNPADLDMTESNGTLNVRLPEQSDVKSKWAWVLKISRWA